jgi:hypothetical protein
VQLTANPSSETIHTGRTRAQCPVPSVAINLLGGGSFRWPGERPLDAETRAKVRRAEIAEAPAQRLGRRERAAGGLDETGR